MVETLEKWIADIYLWTCQMKFKIKVDKLELSIMDILHLYGKEHLIHKWLDHSH